MLTLHLHDATLNVFRTSTSQRSTRRRCTYATSTSCVICICRQKTTLVHKHTHTHNTQILCERCLVVVQSYLWRVRTEAAFTLLLYWELLHWDEQPLKEFLHYPAQSEWHRKEGLCRKVIHYFNKGKVSSHRYTPTWGHPLLQQGLQCLFDIPNKVVTSVQRFILNSLTDALQVLEVQLDFDNLLECAQ